MKINDMANEIIARAGTGFEAYHDRAVAYIWSTLQAIISAKEYRDEDLINLRTASEPIELVMDENYAVFDLSDELRDYLEPLMVFATEIEVRDVDRPITRYVSLVNRNVFINAKHLDFDINRGEVLCLLEYPKLQACLVGEPPETFVNVTFNAEMRNIAIRKDIAAEAQTELDKYISHTIQHNILVKATDLLVREINI